MESGGHFGMRAGLGCGISPQGSPGNTLILGYQGGTGQQQDLFFARAGFKSDGFQLGKGRFEVGLLVANLQHQHGLLAHVAWRIPQ